MSQETQKTDMTQKTAVFQIPGMDAATVRRDTEYRVTDAGVLTMDIYYPPDTKNGSRIPAVVFVLGYSDVGFEKMLGCKQKEMGAYVSWGQLAASSGMAAITYTTREPVADVLALLQYIRRNAASLGIDGNRIGLWACSGNVPNAISLLIQDADADLKCAVLCYGYMLDLDGATGVADAAKTWGFANPSAGKSVSDLSPNIPVFIVRAGHDTTPGLNETMDRFIAPALSRNLPITFVNHADAPHAFDLYHDSEESRRGIKEILAFMRFHLLA